MEPVGGLIPVKRSPVRASAGPGAIPYEQASKPYFAFDENWLKSLTASPASRLSIIRVEGDSMRDAGMRTGDILLIRRQANAREGDIVVAAIPDEITGEPRATVKRLPRSGRMRLLPENPAYEPIENDEITISGKVMGLWRTPI